MAALKLNLADLQFVLRQIKIAEANSTAHSGNAAVALTAVYVDAAGDVVSSDTPGAVLAIPDPHVPAGLRTVDGSYNNLVEGRELWGASGQPMPRLFEPNYVNDTDGDSIDFDGSGPAPSTVQGNYGLPSTVVDADPRTISNLIVDMSMTNPAAVLAALTFAGSEDPMADLAEIMALNLTQAEADLALETATTALATANANLDIAVQNYVDNSDLDPMVIAGLIDVIQESAEALTVAEANFDHAEAVALDPQTAMLDLAAEKGLTFNNGSLDIPNVAPDEGLSAPFNAWMTFFGQFFDHGLDLISKGGNGTVYIPLAADDPLVTHGPDGILGNGDETGLHNSFMALTRSTTVIGPDGEPTQTNVTTPFVDQNQTYTSHASHQVFLREYRLTSEGPVATGKLLSGAEGGLATWADVKIQARDILGIELTDRDVFAVPLLRTDAYGEFIRGTGGFPQLIVGIGDDGIPNTADDITVSGSPAFPVNTSSINVVRTANAFLDDIAHNAVPVVVDGQLVADADQLDFDPETGEPTNAAEVTGNAVAFNPQNGRNLEYDNELLDRHFITGDGRGNENIGLSTVHHVFHSEHNRQVDQQKLTILQSGDLDFINEWLADDIGSLPTGFASLPALDQLVYANTLSWDGERLFQAGRFATEMQYQHLVFEEFGRKIQPNIDIFVFNNVTDVDPSIFAEFANVVYRFGHSMLTENMPRIDANGDVMDDGNLSLIESFLNPVLFDNDGLISHDEGAAAIVRGMTVERGNEIDEFVTGALRNNLLGLPLDLAAINIARGRDTGMPTLNEARQQLYDASGSSFLTPYTSWAEFAANLKNPLSVVNFIAAYGAHDAILAAGTLAEKREAAWSLVFGDGNDADGVTIGGVDHLDRLAFLNSTDGYSAASSGLNDIDLWVGGLAEKKMPFGGMLGSTFNAVFELQMENLQDGDRFYYLTRTQGQNLLNALEQNSFAKMIMANTNLAQVGDDGIRGTADDVIDRHIGVDSFATYDYVFEVNAANQADYAPDDDNSVDPVGNDPTLEALGLTKVVRDDPGTAGPDANYFRTFGGEHVVVGGTENNDTIITDFGDDGIWGDAGDDRIESGAGVDLVNGGAGDDVITDSGDSGDFLKGDEGDDVIANSNGLDIIMGGDGKDAVFVGVDSTEVFGGSGDDFILGGEDSDFLLGNEGDDWMEAGGGFDTTAGDNSELFFNSAIKGHDVMFAGNDEHDFDAESGDDIMVQGESVIRNEGMFGFDWSIWKGVSFGADADLRVPIFTTEQEDILRNRFDKTEALSGWNHDDILRGDDRVFGDIAPGDTVGTTEGIFFEDQLTQAGVDRIDGLRELLGNLIVSAPATGDLEEITAFDRGNFLFGGGGSDLLQGNGGDDFIDGDAWLNVRIRITGDGQENIEANEIATVDSMKHVFTAESAGGNALWVGKSLFELMVSREIKPNQLHIVREVENGGQSGDVDVALFNDTFFDDDGEANYTIVDNGDRSVTITHVNVTGGVIDPVTGRALVSDGIDTLRNIEIARFRDVDISLVNAVPTDIRWNAITPSSNSDLPGNTAAIANLSTVDPDSASWTYSLQPGSSAGFAVSGAGVVTKTGGAMVQNTTYTLNIRSTDSFGGTRDETFTIVAGNNGVNTINVSAATNDTIIYGDDGGDTLTGGAGDDTLFGQDEDDTLVGGLGDDVLHGGTNDTDTASYATATGSVTVNLTTGQATGAAGNDTLIEIENVTGSSFADTITGDNDANTLTGGAGADTINGAGGNDDLEGGADNDTYVFGLADGDDAIQEAGGSDTIAVIGGGAALTALNFTEGGGGNLDIVLGSTEIVVADHFATVDEVVETVTFDTGTSFAGYALAGSYAMSADDNGNRDAIVSSILAGTGGVNTINGSTGRDLLFGNGGSDTLNGGDGDDLLVGGDGNDTINSGDGDDIIVWNVGDDRDIVNGGNDNDTIVINGDAANETYRVYTRDAWDGVAGNNIANLAAATQIVITRGGTGNGAIIAELTGIEEIVINTGDGDDQVLTFGDFSPTSLSQNTITINGGTGDDVVDISSLQSAHRILFRSNGGNDTIVGNLRPQDVVDLAPGQDISTYNLVDNGNGTQTFTNGTHSITFTGAVPPQFGGDSTPDDDAIDGAFEYTPSDLAGLKALVNGLQPDNGEDDEVPAGVRDLGGYDNNADNPTWGAADQAFIRLTQARYGEPDAFGNRAINPIFDGLDPREISNILGAQEAGLPKAGNDANIFFMAMGQYIDHGLDFLPKGGNGSVIIGAEGGGNPAAADPADLTRGTVLYIDENGIPQHKNQTSPYVDQNQAYGSHSLVGQFLRESDGNQGVGMRLLSGAADPSNPDFSLLPTLRELIQHHWNADTIFTDPDLPGGAISFRAYYTDFAISEGVTGNLFDPGTGAYDPQVLSQLTSNFMGSTHPLLLDANPFISALDHYVAGDGRANENFALTAIHTVWARNHNFHVEGLLAAGFEGSPEEVFQAAKMLNEAEYQRVVFDEYLDTLLGGLRSGGTHGFEEYDPDTDPAISHEFAGAVFRFGHSLIGQTMTILDADGNPQEVGLFDAFLNPSNDPSVFTGPLPPGYMPQPGYAQHGVGTIIGGTVMQPAEDVDFNIVDAVRNDLVRIRADLFAFNVARGWDLGIGTLNQVRMDLAASTSPYVEEAVGFAGGDMSAYTSWQDFQARNGLSAGVISQLMQAYPDLILAADDIAAFQAINPDIAVAMQSDGTGIVKGIDRLDLWVGGLAEQHINGGIVGQTFWVVLHEQFERLQDADRFYYIERFDGFDFYENFIDGQEFADIVARNTGKTDLPEHMFRVDDEDDDQVDDDDDDDQVDDDDDDDQVDDDDDQVVDDDDAPTPSPVPGSTIIGTEMIDVLLGTSGADTIVTLARSDSALGGDGDDVIRGDGGHDFLSGEDGQDMIFGGIGHDDILGGAGDDMLYGDGGNDQMFGGSGNDLMDGGIGDDELDGGDGDDVFIGSGGNDAYRGGEGTDTLDLSRVNSNVTVELGTGLGHRGFAMSGETGSDTLWGVENVVTGSGNDTITANGAVNVMDGGSGNNTFRFLSAADAAGDTILGFRPGDRIDLSGIDADASQAGNQSFTLVAGNGFTGPGELTVSHETGEDGEYTFVSGNVSGPDGAEFKITIKGPHNLTASDFDF